MLENQKYLMTCALEECGNESQVLNYNQGKKSLARQIGKR